MGGVEGYDVLCGFIKLCSFGGIGNFDCGVFDVMFEDLMDDFVLLFIVFWVVFLGMWKGVGCIVGIVGDVEGIDWLIWFG